MWLVLCSSSDLPAIWAYEGLRARGLKPIELVTVEELGLETRWEHRLGDDGVSVDIKLSDGGRIHSSNVDGVLNRILWVPTEHMSRVHPNDSEYSTQELVAFFMSWLYALPQPVLNRPKPPGLSGQLRHISEWVWMASKASLPMPEYVQSSRNYVPEVTYQGRVAPTTGDVNTVIVVGPHTVGAPAPNGIKEGCRRLAKFAETELLGVEFADYSAGPWTFVGASAFPDLRLGGKDLLDVLASVLRTKAG